MHGQTPRILHGRRNPMEFYNEDELRRRYRLNKAIIQIVLKYVDGHIAPFTYQNPSINNSELLSSSGFLNKCRGRF